MAYSSLGSISLISIYYGQITLTENNNLESYNDLTIIYLGSFAVISSFIKIFAKLSKILWTALSATNTESKLFYNYSRSYISIIAELFAVLISTLSIFDLLLRFEFIFQRFIF